MASPKRRPFVPETGSPKRHTMTKRRAGVPQEVIDLELAVIHSDVALLQTLLPKVDINMPLNEKQETALMVAIKLSHIHIIEVILADGSCDLSKQNINSYSPFDIAIITTFDNRQEPRHSVCWEITAHLMKAGAEPACPDAMLYVFRTALKMEDAEFVTQFILACVEHCSSRTVHNMVLLKLHRNQPLYMVNSGIDHFLELASLFTIKLIRMAPVSELQEVVQSFVYYLESHWTQRQQKAVILRRLVLYATAGGWRWSPSELTPIKNVSPKLEDWCVRVQRMPKTMAFCCRLSFRASCVRSVQDCLSKMSVVPDAVKDYVLLQDVDMLLAKEETLDLADVKM